MNYDITHQNFYNKRIVQVVVVMYIAYQEGAGAGPLLSEEHRALSAVDLCRHPHTS